MRRLKADGTCALKLSVTHKRKVRYVALGLSLEPGMWSAAACRVSARHRQARSLNSWLARCRLDAEEAVMEVLMGSSHRDALQVGDFACAVVAKLRGDSGAVVKRDSFAELLVRFASLGKKDSTRRLYLSTLARMRAFDQRADALMCEDITREWLEGFDAFMARTGPSRNYRNIHLRNIRAVFNAAIEQGLTVAYPFRRLKIRPVATVKRSLSVERLRELFGYDVEPYARRYVDMFKLVFFLCGINVIDLCHLRHVADGRVDYYRSKTGRLYSVKVEPEAMALIEKYRGKGYLLDVMDRHSDHRNFMKRMNMALQRIGVVERRGRGGRKVIVPAFPGLTSYWARHTWASIAADLDIPDAVIAMALGHASLYRTTEIYINRSLRKVDEANRRVMDWVLYGIR